MRFHHQCRLVQVDANAEVALVVMGVLLVVLARKNVRERKSELKPTQDYMANSRTQTKNASLRSFALRRRCTYRFVLIEHQCNGVPSVEG